jgi:hypothetical protein
MITGAGIMSDNEVSSMLLEMVHEHNARGNDHFVEALTLAADALTWLPLRDAPRDGTNIVLAVAPMLNVDAPGFVCIGRWVEPTSEELAKGESLGRPKRERVEISGGWWAAGKHRRTFRRPVVGWRPVPRFDFEAAGYIPGEVVTING